MIDDPSQMFSKWIMVKLHWSKPLSQNQKTMLICKKWGGKVFWKISRSIVSRNES